MKKIYIDNDINFYKNIKKYKDKDSKLYFNYDKKNIDDELNFKILSIKAANIKDINKRYNYIYDEVCNYLDKKFNNENICDFNNNKCISVRNKSHCSESLNGCCYGKKRGLCKSFKDGRCTIKSISCKLFTCRYLRHNNIRFKTNDIPLLKYFFNIKQKFIIETSLFKDKEEILTLLMKYK